MSRPCVLFHCNAGNKFGMGHVMRSLGLAEEASSRGWEIRFTGDLSVEAQQHVRKVLPSASVDAIPFENAEAVFEAETMDGVDIVHFDSYWTIPDFGHGHAIVSNMQDGPFGARAAHLAIDANLGAETWFVRPDQSQHHLAGIDAAVIRGQVLRQRNVAVTQAGRPRVLVVMGGTDPLRLTSAVVEGLARSDEPMDITVVAAHDRHAQIQSLITDSPHTLSLRTFVDDLPAVARQQELVITAAGTSVWDFACMGSPMALVCAVENQQRGYRSAIDAGLGIPLGEPPHTELAERVARLPGLLEDLAWTGGQREHLQQTVDGLGAWRIVSAWEELLEPLTPGPTAEDLVARRATMTDARTLFEWRNDETTRANSRSMGALSWQGHVAWLERCLADEARILLMVHTSNEDVGTVRWDRHDVHDWEASITLAPSSRGRGLSPAVLAAGEEALATTDPVRMLASIHTANTASHRLFRRAGYLPYLPADADGYETRAKWRLVSTG